MELDKAPGYGEIGYWVAKEARGKGVATRAVTLLRDWAAQESGCELIELMIHSDNELSVRVAERTGFLDTGERRTAPAPGGRHRARPRGLRLERRVERRACGARSRPSRTSGRRRAAIRASVARVVEQRASARSASASGSPGATSSAPSISGKPPTRVSSSGLPNASAVNSTPDWSISR